MEIDNLENSQPSKFAKYAQIKIVAFRNMLGDIQL